MLTIEDLHMTLEQSDRTMPAHQVDSKDLFRFVEADRVRLAFARREATVGRRHQIRTREAEAYVSCSG